MNGSLREIREVVREEPLMHRPILDALAAGPLSIPELARAIDRPSQEVVVWIMGMRRYRMVVEVGEADDEGYFRYAATDAGGGS